MSSTTTAPVLDLELESTTAPKPRELPYVQQGASAEVIGGARVFLSRSRKNLAAGKDAPVMLTCEDGSMQQSIPYRAIAGALTHDIVPMSQVVTRYVKSGRLAELVELVSREVDATGADAPADDAPAKDAKGKGAEK